MVKNLNTELAKIILHGLSRQPLSRTELEKHTVQKGGTHASFESTFSHLVYGGYVEKSSPKYRAKYVITDKGVALLKALEEPKH
jgi:DNA-binding PadR family transcriptional regulator